MANTLLINARPYQTRVALLEDDRCVEYYTEEPSSANLAGNIYLGKVRRVLPGMQAAFVDIGLPKAAFLYAGDVCDPWEGTDRSYKEISLEGQSCQLPRSEEMPKIEVLLKVGQEVVVQVAKEPLGEKGPRVTNYIALPGHHLVFMPSVTHVGISRRIESEEERERLRTLVDGLRENDGGFIVRTAAAGLSEEKLAAEMKFLYSLWRIIRNRWEKSSAPALLYRDLSVSLRAVRDLFSQEVQKMVIDCPYEYKPVMEFIGGYMPALASQVEFYKESTPLFKAYGVEDDLKGALKSKIWLRSGGYVIFQRTEALTVVDVNTGRYVGSHNLEETMLNTNLEAVREIAYQLRLRNIGGLIVIDFIDMQQEESRALVVSSLNAALAKDRSKTNVLDMSPLGLVEMTRKRVREPWALKEQEACPMCHGDGFVKTAVTICHDIFRAMENRFGYMQPVSNVRTITLRVNPEIYNTLNREEHISLAEMQHRMGLVTNIKSDPSLHRDEFYIEPA